MSPTTALANINGGQLRSKTPASLVPNLLLLLLGVTQSAPITLIGPMEPIARYQDTGHHVFQMNGPLNNPVADFHFSLPCNRQDEGALIQC